MIGITKACRNPDAAWKLIEFLYFSDEGLAARRKISDILPPVTSVWNEPHNIMSRTPILAGKNPPSFSSN